MQISFLYPCICTCSDRTFATHFETWREEMEKAETGLRLFVKQEIADLGLNIAPALLFLSRLDRLHLSCFHVERRYFDLAQIFVNELKSLKDSYANFSFMSTQSYLRFFQFQFVQSAAAIAAWRLSTLGPYCVGTIVSSTHRRADGCVQSEQRHHRTSEYAVDHSALQCIIVQFQVLRDANPQSLV